METNDLCSSRVLWIKALYLFNRKRHTLLSYEDLFLQIHTCNIFLPNSPLTQASLSCTACQISPLQLIGYPGYRDIGYRLLVTCDPISGDIFPDGNHHGSNPDEGWMATVYSNYYAHGSSFLRGSVRVFCTNVFPQILIYPTNKFCLWQPASRMLDSYVCPRNHKGHFYVSAERTHEVYKTVLLYFLIRTYVYPI